MVHLESRWIDKASLRRFGAFEFSQDTHLDAEGCKSCFPKRPSGYQELAHTTGGNHRRRYSKKHWWCAFCHEGQFLMKGNRYY